MGQARGAGHSQEQREAPRGFSREPHGITDFTYDSHRSQQGKCFESRPGKGGASSRATSCVRRAQCPKHEYQNAQTFWFRKTLHFSREPEEARLLSGRVWGQRSFNSKSLCLDPTLPREPLGDRTEVRTPHVGPAGNSDTQWPD